VTDPCDDDLLIGSDANAGARALAVRGFTALWHGRQPRVVDFGVDGAVVHTQVRAGRLEIDEFGRLVGVHGLVARATAHRIEHSSGVVHTWCALDAIGIPAALRVDAIAITHCPACSTEIRVTLTRGEPNDARDFRLWLPSGPCAHLVDDFCRHTNLFCNAEHLATVMPPNAAGSVVTVNEAATIGRNTWKDVSHVLQPFEDRRP